MSTCASVKTVRLRADVQAKFCLADTEGSEEDVAEKAAAGTALPADDSDFLSGDSEDDSNSLVSQLCIPLCASP